MSTKRRHFLIAKTLFQRRNKSNLSVKPFESIPGPSGNGLPFVGHTHMLVKKPHGFEKSWLNIQEMVKKYQAEDARLLRFRSPVLNPENGQVLFLLDPLDVEHAYKKEGKYPKRGPAFEPYKLMRQARPHIYQETTGVLTEDGECWQDTRSKVQQDLMRPKSAHYYLAAIQDVGEDFIQFIKQKRSEDNVIEDCLPEIYKYTLESIALIALDARLGCLQIPMDPELQRFFDASKAVFDAFGGFVNSPSWKFLPDPRWNKNFREADDAFQIVLDYCKKQMDLAIEKIDKKTEETEEHDMSILEKLVKRCETNSTYPLIMSMDLMMGGMDTTGNSLGFLLYWLATNPEKQEKLRKECQNLGQNLTVKDLNQLKYLKACMLEANRLTPTVSIFVRIIPEDMVLRGYHIPKGTQLTWSPFIFQQQFPDHEKFLPERWLENKKEICPFAVRQFSHGPRMCIGKRFAELELLTVTNKLMNNFEVKCINTEPLTISQTLVNVPDEPLNFQFIDL